MTKQLHVHRAIPAFVALLEQQDLAGAVAVAQAALEEGHAPAALLVDLAAYLTAGYDNLLEEAGVQPSENYWRRIANDTWAHQDDDD